MPALELDVLRRTPAYPFVEAAEYLRLPISTLRSWILGQNYQGADGRRREFRPLIHLDGERGQGLSFLNLVEAHVLSAITRLHHIPLQQARVAASFVAERMGIQRPFLSIEFQTDGYALFVDELGHLINVSEDGQIEIRDVIEAHLHRIMRDASGIPIKLYPFTRPRSGRGQLPIAVEIDPRISFGRPVLAGSAVPTAVLADRFKAGDTFSDLANDYDTSADKIEEAIRCEFDRRKVA